VSITSRVKKGFKRLNVDIPEKVHRKLRIEAFSLGLKVGEMVALKLAARTPRRRRKRAKRRRREKKEEPPSMNP